MDDNGAAAVQQPQSFSIPWRTLIKVSVAIGCLAIAMPIVTLLINMMKVIADNPITQLGGTLAKTLSNILEQCDGTTSDDSGTQTGGGSGTENHKAPPKLSGFGHFFWCDAMPVAGMLWAFWPVLSAAALGIFRLFGKVVPGKDWFKRSMDYLAMTKGQKALDTMRAKAEIMQAAEADGNDFKERQKEQFDKWSTSKQNEVLEARANRLASKEVYREFSEQIDALRNNEANAQKMQDLQKEQAKFLQERKDAENGYPRDVKDAIDDIGPIDK